jgi:hypothetical protein
MKGGLGMDNLSRLSPTTLPRGRIYDAPKLCTQNIFLEGCSLPIATVVIEISDLLQKPRHIKFCKNSPLAAFRSEA